MAPTRAESHRRNGSKTGGDKTTAPHRLNGNRPWPDSLRQLPPPPLLPRAVAAPPKAVPNRERRRVQAERGAAVAFWRNFSMAAHLAGRRLTKRRQRSVGIGKAKQGINGFKGRLCAAPFPTQFAASVANAAAHSSSKWDSGRVGRPIRLVARPAGNSARFPAGLQIRSAVRRGQGFLLASAASAGQK